MIEKIMKKNNLVWIFPTIIFSVLVLLGSTLHPLWGDEAETAFFAKTILQKGVPFGFDGVNISSLVNGALYNHQLINHASPWFQFYLTAFSFKLFGVSVFSARLPFIFLSISTIPLLYFLVKKILSGGVAFFAVIISSLCVPWILFAYQDRYYSLTIFFGMLMLYSAISLTSKKIWPKIIFPLSCTLYIYSHYVSFATFYLSLLMGLIFYFRKETKRFYLIGYVVGSGIVAGLLFAPWYLILKPFAGNAGFVMPSISFVLQSLPELIYFIYSYFNYYAVLPILLLPLLVFVLIKNRSSREGWLLASIAFLYILFVSLISLFSVSGFTVPTEIRYNTVLFPIFISIAAYLFWEILKWNKWVFAVLISLYVFSNLLTLAPVRFYVWEYLGEITHPYVVSDELVAKYLKTHAKDGDTAFINSDRAHEPAMFLLDLPPSKKIKFINRVNPITPNIFPDNYKVLPRYLYSFLAEPDWVILYSTHKLNLSEFDFDLRGTYPRGLSSRVDLANDYTKEVLPIFYGSDVARPELERHRFSAIVPEYNEQVFIYHKK